MTNLYHPSRLIALFGLMMIFFASCLPNNDEIERAFINLKAQFTDSGNMTPITGARVDIFAQFSTGEDSFYQGPAVTNDNGVIEGFLDSPEETTLTKLTFILTVDNEEFTVIEDVSASFRFDEPYNDVDLLLEVPVTEAEE